MISITDKIYVGTAAPEGGGGATIEELNVTPSTSAQVITAGEGVDGYSPVNVSAVTASIDANIQAGNIKSGVEILGVTGNVTELDGETQTVSLTSISGNTFTPTSPKNAITSITVTPTNEVITVTPSTSAQLIEPQNGYSGIGSVSVNAVTASIDANITSGNIKNGVTILGVTGNVNALVGQTKSVSQNGVVTPDAGYNGLTSVSVNVPSSLVKANYWVYDNGTVENIRTYDSSVKLAADATTINNQDLRNVYSDLSPAEITKVSFGAIITISYDNALYNSFSGDSYLTEIDFPSLTTISGNYALYWMLRNCTALENINMPKLSSISGNYCCYETCNNKTLITDVNLSSLTSTNGDSCCYCMFSGCTALTTVNLSSLTTVSGQYCCQGMFLGCTALVNVDIHSLSNVSKRGLQEMFTDCTSLVNVNLSSLSVIGDRGLMNTFKGCTSLENVYFNSLTTTSFDFVQSSGYEFLNLLYNTGTNVTHTLHFPSNLSSTISGLTGYPLFGGTSGYVTLAFDLPATS